MCKIPLFDAYLFDLDGTVYLGDQAIPGALECIERLKARGAKVMYVTNKPLSTPEEYAAKLTGLGIHTVPEEIITSSMVLAWYLEREQPEARVLLVGEENVREDLQRVGMRFVEDPAKADVVALSWTRSFCYNDLNAMLQALLQGATFVATNPDVVCPVDAGAVVPDCGALIAAVTACSGRTCDYMAGKPEPMLPLAALERLNVAPANAALVGDRLDTDIASGNRAGMSTVCVLTGVTSAAMAREAVDQMRPDYVIATVADLN